MKKPEVAANLIEYINTQIITGRYPVGSKLPSLRLLARKFQISYTSAWNGIEYLERQGKLHKSARRGIFVQSRNAVNEASPEQQLALVAPHFTSLNDTNGLFHSTLSVLEQLAAEHHYSLMVIPMPNVKILDSATVEKLNRCRGVILMKEIDGWLTAMQITVPTVGILMENNYGGQLSLVGIDPYAAAQEAVSFFLARGISQVHLAYVNYPCYRLRAKLFEMLWTEAGGIVTGHYAQYPESGADMEYFAPDRGYFFASDSLLYAVITNHREKYGRDPFDPERMIAVDGKNLIMPWEFRFPTIALDWREVGRAAFEECMALIDDPTRRRRRIYLSGQFTQPEQSR